MKFKITKFLYKIIKKYKSLGTFNCIIRLIKQIKHLIKRGLL